MSIKKTDSIAYLFKEMDPSEKVEFERLLRKNDNLLIEVESLRNISSRIDQLPEISAPDTVIQSVCEQASERKKSSKIVRSKPFYFATAALLSIGFMAGALLIESDETASNTENASVGSVGSIQATSTNNAAGTAADREITPWVDENNILHYTGLESDRSDSLLENSYRRLTPVTNPSQNSSYQRNLHLTGSRQ
jgi:anti-sigma factor RsiW